jgi:hypothetical protein
MISAIDVSTSGSSKHRTYGGITKLVSPFLRFSLLSLEISRKNKPEAKAIARMASGLLR